MPAAVGERVVEERHRITVGRPAAQVRPDDQVGMPERGCDARAVAGPERLDLDRDADLREVGSQDRRRRYDRRIAGSKEDGAAMAMARQPSRDPQGRPGKGIHARRVVAGDRRELCGRDVGMRLAIADRSRRMADGAAELRVPEERVLNMIVSRSGRLWR